MTITLQLPDVTLSNSLRVSKYLITNIDGLTDSPEPTVESDERENAHGDFGQADIWQQARFITIEGTYFGESVGDLFEAGEVLKALASKHFEAWFTVPNGVRRTEVALASKVRWAPSGEAAAKFEFTLKADDPRLYGPLTTASTGVPTSGVGIADPILDPIQEGEEGNAARVRLVNGGTAPSEPLTTIHGGVSEGFELLCIESSRVVTVTRPIPDGSFVLVDHARGEVWLDGESLLPSTYIPSAEWFDVGPGETCTIQWRPRGMITGTPSMSVEFAEASW